MSEEKRIDIDTVVLWRGVPAVVIAKRESFDIRLLEDDPDHQIRKGTEASDLSADELVVAR